MGFLSVSSHRGLVHWQKLLLVVSLFNFWCLPITVQPAFWSKNAVEGDDVLLRIPYKPSNATRLMWFRRKGVDKNCIIAFLTATPRYRLRGPAHGPLTISSDGSLLLSQVTRKDTGIYTVIVQQQDSKILKGFGQLTVYRNMREPTLLSSNTTVTENKDAVVMTCYTDVLYPQWLFNGTTLQLTERMKLSQENRTLTIDPVKREDAGEYQCELSNPAISAASMPLELNVKFE